ncbi:MAG: hypothetical protein RIQ54_226, partial [Candidatus Parcubacteria bacterium]
LGVLYFTNTDSKGRIRYEGLQRYDNWEKGKLFFNDGNFENFINHGKTSLDPIENNLAEPISPRQKEVADTTAKQAVKLSIKIVEGNPRKLAPCPKNQNERFDNCWGKKVELDQEYEGEWLNDSKTGFGIVRHSNGAKYVGEFTEGKSNGLGVLYFPNTDPKGRYSYEGLQENDKKIKGKLLFNDGNFEFVFKVRKTSSYGQNSATMNRQAEQLPLKTKGENPNNLASCPKDKNARFHNCWGILTFENGDRYVGEFKDNKRNGQGTYTWPDGSKYAGEYKDNIKDGQGTYTWPDGSKYAGEWKDDDVHGRGIQYSSNGSVFRSGFFANGKLKKSEPVDPKSFSSITE